MGIFKKFIQSHQERTFKEQYGNFNKYEITNGELILYINNKDCLASNSNSNCYEYIIPDNLKGQYTKVTYVFTITDLSGLLQVTDRRKQESQTSVEIQFTETCNLTNGLIANTSLPNSSIRFMETNLLGGQVILTAPLISFNSVRPEPPLEKLLLATPKNVEKGTLELNDTNISSKQVTYDKSKVKIVGENGAILRTLYDGNITVISTSSVQLVTITPTLQEGLDVGSKSHIR